MAQIWTQSYGHNRGGVKSVAEDRPSLQHVAGGVRLEMMGRDAAWTIELTRDECERIAEAIGRRSPTAWPQGGDE